MPPAIRKEDGFTLIELLVTMFIIGVVFAAFGLVISTTVRHIALITNEDITQHSVRTALDQMTEDLREATVSSTSDTSPFVTPRPAASCRRPRSRSMRPTGRSPPPTRPTITCARSPTRSSGGNSQRSSAVSTNVARPAWTIPPLGAWAPLLGGIDNSVTSPVFTYLDAGTSTAPAPTTGPAAVRTVVITVNVAVPGTTHQFSYSATATPRETPPSSSSHEPPAPETERRVGPDDDARRLRDRASSPRLRSGSPTSSRARRSRAATPSRATPPTRQQSRGSTAMPRSSSTTTSTTSTTSPTASRPGCRERSPHPRARRGRATSPGPTRSGRTAGRTSATATPTTSRSPPRADRRRRSRRRSRSSRPAAAGTASWAAAAPVRTAPRARSRRCSCRRRSRTSR